MEPGQIAAALFCDELSHTEKSRLAARILSLLPKDFKFLEFPEMDSSISLSNLPAAPPSSDSMDRGKPPLPEISPSKALPDYVTPRSVVFLARFCPNADKWHKESPPWDHIKEYQTAKAIVRGVCPVNDPAERLCAIAKKYRVFARKAIKS